MCRGNNKRIIFRDDQDKWHYLFLLLKFRDENKISIYHYCLMNNHVHLIVVPEFQSTLSRYMKQVNLSYFWYYKRKYGYTGHLWQGRFKSNFIEADNHLLHCGKYVELNPVRANLVHSPDKYRFSSYNYYASGNYDSLLTPSPSYLGLSEFPERRKKLYHEFVVDQTVVNTEKLAKEKAIGSEDFLKRLGTVLSPFSLRK